MKGHEKHLPGNLSGAWRQRLALACSIVHKPPMLFLDEPTAGVDPVSRREFWELIYSMAGQGVSVLATTHYMDEAEFCNMIGMMYRSRLIALDDPDSLKEGIDGVLFEVDCNEPGRAEQLLKQLSGVKDVAAHGVNLHVLTSSEDEKREIEKLLNVNRIQIQRIERVLPSLEDLIVSFVTKKTPCTVAQGLIKEALVGQSFRRMLTIVRKEWLHIIRDPRTLGLVIVMPVMMLFLLGYAVANDVEDIPLVVADLSHTEESRTLVDKLTVSGFFKYTHSAQSENEILKMLDAGLVKAGLFIPENFGRSISTGKVGTVQFYIDGSNPTVAQTAQLAAETVSQSMSQEILIKRLERSGTGMELNLPVDARLRYLYNPDMKRMNFMIPGLVAIILQIQTLLLTAFAIVREREQGTLEQLIVTPVRSWELMLGKILPFVVVAFVNVIMTVAVGAIWFGVKVAGSIALLAVLSLIFLLGSLGLGVFISNISKTQMQAMYMASFIMIPSFILAGLLFPRENMPWPAYFAGYLLPVTYFLEIVLALF